MLTSGVTMRRKPVTRSEIRLNGQRISTLPADAVRKDADGYIVPIAKLWAPLLRSLSEGHMPERYYFLQLKLRTCQRCGHEFYGVSLNGRYCSDTCAKASWREGRAVSIAAMVKARSEARAAARTDRRCARCNELITAQRSTGKFCSVRCRVAAHRERAKGRR